MAKLYAITHGEYSDYSILTLCSDREKAEKLVEWYNRYDRYDHAEVEEYEDSLMVPDESLIPYEVLFNADGSIRWVYKGSYPLNAVEGHMFRCDDGRFYAYVLAADEEGAEKIAAEKRAKWIAENTGVV